jgi:hypothetical protein
MILPDDNIVPNPVDDPNGEVVDNLESVSHPDLAANLDGDGNSEFNVNPDVAPNPEGVANPNVAPNLDDDVDGDDAEEDHANADDDWGEADEVEYVGVDDENEKYKDVLNDDGDADCDCYPDTDLEDDDPLVVDDERDCEGVVHVTDIDNPKIALGVTFEGGFCFKRCIRQYVMLNEVELAVSYSESWWYKAYCKTERCRWRIHAS